MVVTGTLLGSDPDLLRGLDTSPQMTSKACRVDKSFLRTSCTDPKGTGMAVSVLFI